METAEKILKELRFGKIMSDNQTELISPMHTRFVIIIRRGNDRLKFPFQCNKKYQKPELENTLYSVLLDATSYMDAEDMADFLWKFGYGSDEDAIRKGIKAYESCKNEAEKIAEMFTEDEIAKLYNYLEEKIG